MEPTSFSRLLAPTEASAVPGRTPWFKLAQPVQGGRPRHDGVSCQNSVLLPLHTYLIRVWRRHKDLKRPQAPRPMGCTRLTSQHGDGHRNSPMARRWARAASALSSASCCVYVSKSGRAETMLGRPRSRRDGHCCSHPTSASFCQLFNWSGSDSWGSWWRATLQRGLITLLGPVLLAMRSSAISKWQEAPPANCTHEGRWEAQLHLHFREQRSPWAWPASPPVSAVSGAGVDCPNDRHVGPLALCTAAGEQPWAPDASLLGSTEPSQAGLGLQPWERTSSPVKGSM